MKTSSSRVTMKAATTWPRRAVSLMPFTPWMPRFLRVKLLDLGALAVAGIGDEQDGGVVAGDVAGHHLVLGRSFMPRTPAAERPMARTSSSAKRTVMPERLTMKMSSPSLQGMTLTSSSPSRRLMAMSPARSDESYSVNRVFLTWPLRVAKNRYWLDS